MEGRSLHVQKVKLLEDNRTESQREKSKRKKDQNFFQKTSWKEKKS